MRRWSWTAAALAALVGSAGSVNAQNESAADRARERANRNARLAADPAQPFDPGSVLVKYKDGTGEDERAAARGRAGAKVRRKFEQVAGLEHLAVADAQAAIVLLRADPAVEYAEPDYVMRVTATPNDASYYWEWGLNNTGQLGGSVVGTDIDAPEAWNTFTGDPNFVIAVIDDGTNWAHPDLAQNMWSNPGEIAGNGVDDDRNGYIDDTRGWDFYTNDNNPDSEGFHGTHTAGTIGAQGNNGTGVAGVVWRCRIMPLRFLGPNGGYTSDAVEALNYAVAKGVKLSNNSWGGGGYSQALYDALNAARASGHLFIAAAGNGGADQIGDNNDVYPNYPSGYNLDNVISVAAIDAAGQLGGFSNYGAATVDLAAPGVSIYSTAYDGYGWSNGTSMAAPHVTGVAALVWGQNPTMTYQQVRTRLLTTTRPLASLAGRTVTGGLLNANNALVTAVNTAPAVTITAPASGAAFTQGSSISFAGQASDAQDGDLSGGVSWTSNLQGLIGTGAAFSRGDLIAGTHTITASVTDSGGMSAGASVTITVTTPPPSAAIPAAPTSMTASASGSTVTLRWTDASSNESGFQIEREYRQNANRWINATIIGSVGADVSSVTTTASRGTWRYRVRAFNASGSSAWSGWATVTVR